ncbi:predicted protein [Histoplasma capsulatum var. duboisii H88]|uniref:Predicted protein n=2 Tax=Ajellomyces capsulatus TaxID=5037 RepID=F0UPD9_AJEC8|nr:predicted protein [Histoplasma capsulatum H143]EGC46945.1 predicted protein [Histoplasma capsulatum var. duboisii H88]QSS53118.1 hypothetical protein I7I53_00281 [Histoplasma capsulatum var. duboisii H88]
MFATTRHAGHNRGIQLVVYRGRYYAQKIFTNPDGAYVPDILYTIPLNSVEYSHWLETTRQEYAAKDKVLEDFVFTLHSSQACSDAYVKQKLQEIDLYQLPSPLPPKRCGRYPPLFTIDLDLQVVSFGTTIHLSLTDLPSDRNKFFAAPASPSFRWPCLPMAAHHLVPFPSPLPAELKCDLYNYGTGYRAIPLLPNRWLSADPGPFWPFYELVFSNFKAAYSHSTRQAYIRWSPCSFMFRELAYAIISMASGRVYFRIEDSERPHIPSDKASWPSELGLGYHLANHFPGSAPDESIYWFDNVLVSLFPEIPGRRHIYIEKTVSFGLRQGNLAFQAILLSLSTTMLLDVEVVDGIPVVKHTDPLELFGDCQVADISSNEPPLLRSLSNLQIYQPQSLPAPPSLTSKEAFRALSSFFATATLRCLKPHGRETQGLLPNEIYYMILDYTDNATFHTCARVSYLFRSYCLSKIRICQKNENNEEHICDTSSPIDAFTHQIIQIGSPLSLTLQNRASRELTKWCPSKASLLSWSPKPIDDLYLVPIFGEPNRLSESQQAINIFTMAQEF